MDAYDTLGVASAASQSEIKQAYRRLARELHPDLTGGDKDSSRRLAEVNAAYETIDSPLRRAVYDLHRLAVRYPGHAFSGHDPHVCIFCRRAVTEPAHPEPQSLPTYLREDGTSFSRGNDRRPVRETLRVRPERLAAKGA